jgi:hypothetical protein
MKSHEQPPAMSGAPAPPTPEKRAYKTPQVTDLGDVQELTRGGGGSNFDGPKNPPKK